MTESSISLGRSSASLPSTTQYVHNNASTSPHREVRSRPRSADIRFAHPAETEIARLLTFYDVRWQYEPTTFALVTGENGKPVQCFTPDFYLPDQDLYIEMTTMRQSLVTRKNRKFRLLRELYPELNVKLLYRKDVEHILDRFSRSQESVGREAQLQQVIREEQIQRRAGEMAEALIDGSSRPDCLLALGESAIRTRDLVADRLSSAGSAVKSGVISVTGYSPGGGGCDVGLESDSALDLTTADVVVVADIVGTGLTALAASRWLRAQGAGRGRLVSLLDRRSSRLVDVPLEFAGFTVTSSWHVGAGLGRSKRYRDLPDIHSLISPPIA